MLLRGPGQQVAGDLFDGELVERLVGIERLDDVVAIEPDRSWRVVGIACRISVARQVEPEPCPVFAVRAFGQQPIDELLIGFGTAVVDELFYLLKGRRQAGEVERKAANEGVAIGLGRRLQALALQAREQERVDGVFRPRHVLDLRQSRTQRLDIRPVFGVGSPLLDPAREQLDLLRRKLLAGLARRHALGRVGRCYPGD